MEHTEMLSDLSIQMSEVTTFDKMIGHTASNIDGMSAESQEIVFTLDDGSKARFYHEQDCCEYVCVIDVVGDPGDLVGSPILVAEEVGTKQNEGDFESQTWTFYKFSTIKGSVTVRWLGESNGYYSEGVDYSHIAATGNEAL